MGIWKNACRFPGCKRQGTQIHHIIFRSYSKKVCLLEPWNTVRLCSIHHLHGKDSPHQSREWKEYYRKFLPSDWKERIKNCTELRKSSKKRIYG
jgi:hypothetical protein